MKRLAILGSTGSIGTQALEVVTANPGLFQVEVLSAHSNSALLIEQAKKFKCHITSASTKKLNLVSLKFVI